jgi:hypothetical protein
VAASTSSSQFSRRRVRLALAHGRAIEGNIHATEAQSLTVFMATRRYYASLTEARWIGGSEDEVPHLAVRVDQILWAQPLDRGLAVSMAQQATMKPRRAEITMKDGTTLHASMFIAEEQRMTDYIDSAFGFLPLRDAVESPGGERLGDVALNADILLAIREEEGEAD